MTHRRTSFHLALATALGLLATAASPASTQTPATAPDEVSGAALLPDGRVLLVDDDEHTRAFLLDPETGAWTPLPLPRRLNDLEGCAADRDGTVFLLTSHTPSRRGKLPPERRLLVGIEYAGGSWRSSARVVRSLRRALTEALHTEARRLDLRPDGRPLDLEGIACTPAGDRLWIGARAPLIDGQAALFEIDVDDRLFQTESPSVRVHRLDLDGGGIRGLTLDPAGDELLLLAGAGDAGGEAVYRWRSPGKARMLLPSAERPAPFGSLPQPEGITARASPDTTTFELIVFSERLVAGRIAYERLRVPRDRDDATR